MLALMFIRSWDTKYMDNTTRKTRRADATILKVPNANCNKFTKSPIFHGSTLWNSLPVNIRSAKTKLQFKTMVLHHLTGPPPLDGTLET